MVIPLSKLILWNENYNEGNIGAIAISIRRFGFANAPRIWNGEVRGGNHTVMALRQIKAEGALPETDQQFPPANIKVDKKTGDWLIECIDVSYLSEVEALAYAIADNHIAKQASEDEGLLLNYLNRLHHEDEGLLRATAYDLDDIAMLEQIQKGFDTSFQNNEPPSEFPTYDENIPVEHICPKCGYAFSGGHTKPADKVDA